MIKNYQKTSDDFKKIIKDNGKKIILEKSKNRGMFDKDTARILIDWECNLSCSYCCNEQERFRRDILPVFSLDEINFNKYKFFCLSGGEPLLFPEKIQMVLNRIPNNKFIILYTNGILFTKKFIQQNDFTRINALNVGLHNPKSFKKIIEQAIETVNFSGLDISLRFHLNDRYKLLKLEETFPFEVFKYWIMDDCERNNEDRFVLRS